jgi:hypothetical protein
MNFRTRLDAGRRLSRWTLAAACAGALTAMLAAAPSAQAKGIGDDCDTATTPFCDALMSPIDKWSGHVFFLSQNYPKSIPQDKQPWKDYDPYKDPGGYLRAALAYFYIGNIQLDNEYSFDPSRNRFRAWYHAPWQDRGVNGREFVHGLTRERVSAPYELSDKQRSSWNNYAVGFYNGPGGFTLGQVWANHGKPNPDLASFPEGTVSAKLLFTTASKDEVPYLADAPQWQAYVYCDANDPYPKVDSKRCITTVRLVQIDIAVKDSRAKETGWVFGTFVYGGGPNYSGSTNYPNAWDNVQPVGVMWGNDPGLVPPATPTQSWLNPAVKMLHYGYQGRLNGPVDNKVSACLSCHSTAQWPMSAPLIPPPHSTQDVIAWWFRNIPSGTPFGPPSPFLHDDQKRASLDYSLQLAGGIRNFFEANKPLLYQMFPKTESARDIKRDLGYPVDRGADGQ